MVVKTFVSAFLGRGRAPVLFWLFTAMTAGAILMSLELTGFRLYAPYFGYSIYVWGGMISTMMLALAAGYWLGGRLADRAEDDSALFMTIVFSAAYQLVILLSARLFLPALADMGDLSGVIGATLIIFVPSMTALAAAGPMIIRLCTLNRAVGSAAGRVYALSTAGSIAGILATSFVLVPRFGTEATLKLLCAATFLAGAAGLSRRRSVFTAAILIPVPLISSVTGLGWSRGALWAEESPYNLVRVVRRGNERFLQLNNSSSVQTVQADAGPSGYYYDAFALGPLFTPGRRMLVLGMGGGASIHAARITAPDIDIDAVEIDAKVVEAAWRWFGIRESNRLRIHVADARRWLARTRSVYDLVELDLYQGGPYIPFYLATREFFQLVSSRMSSDGVVMMNVFDAGPKHELVFAVGATLQRVFPSVMAIRTQSANYLLVAFRRKTSQQTVRAVLTRAPQFLDRWREIQPMAPPPGAPCFTDDLAPIEQITHRMLRFR